LVLARLDHVIEANNVEARKRVPEFAERQTKEFTKSIGLPLRFCISFAEPGREIQPGDRVVHITG
jgi:hypothetical protein